MVGIFATILLLLFYIELLHLQEPIQKSPWEHKLLLAKHELYVNKLLVLIDLDDLSLSKFLVINNIACLNPL